MGRKRGPQAAELGLRFGQNLLELRGRVGLSQVATMERAGLNRTEINLLEHGRRLPRLDTLVKLAGAVRSGALRVAEGDVLGAGTAEGGIELNALGQEDRWVMKEWTLGERFGANVVWFRRQAGLTQEQLAGRAGINRTILSRIERGRRLPRLDVILKLVAALGVENCDLVAWMWWDPPRHHHYESAASDSSGCEVLDFHLPAGLRISPVGYESEERFKDRLRQRGEDPDHRRVLELLRDDAPKGAPRERPDTAWVLRTGQALRALREERGLTRQELADRSPTTAEFIGEIEEGRCSDPDLWILEELCRALKGEGSALSAQIEPVRAAMKAAVQEVLDELAERDARAAES